MTTKEDVVRLIDGLSTEVEAAMKECRTQPELVEVRQLILTGESMAGFERSLAACPADGRKLLGWRLRMLRKDVDTWFDTRAAELSRPV